MEKYNVKEYIELLKQEDILKETIDCEKIMDKQVDLVSYNSKEVQENTLFVVKGALFKNEYLKEAIDNGVFVYVSENKFDVDIPCILVTDIRKALSCMTAMYFNYP